MRQFNQAILATLVQLLDKTIPRDGAVVLEGRKDEEGPRIVANQLGYLNLGVEVLKAASAEITREGRSGRIGPGLSYLVGVDKVCHHFEQREDANLLRTRNHRADSRLSLRDIPELIPVFLLILVRVKKYFYVLRPILACRWVAAHGTMPPEEFASLVEDQLPLNLRAVIYALLERKRSGDELAKGARIPEINDFLDTEIARIGGALAGIPRAPEPDREALDRVFRQSLREVWREDEESSRAN